MCGHIVNIVTYQNPQAMYDSLTFGIYGNIKRFYQKCIQVSLSSHVKNSDIQWLHTMSQGE